MKDYEAIKQSSISKAYRSLEIGTLILHDDYTCYLQYKDKSFQKIAYDSKIRGSDNWKPLELFDLDKNK